MSDLRLEMRKSPHLMKYIEAFKKRTSQVPRYFDEVDGRVLAEIKREATLNPEMANFIYPIEGGYVHINAITSKYAAIEQTIDDDQRKKLERIKASILEKAAKEKACETNDELRELLDRLFDQSVSFSRGSLLSKLNGQEKVPISKGEKDLLKYFIQRDIVGYGPIQPLIRDPFIEDIHLVGTDWVHIVHKAFQYGLETNVKFEENDVLNDYLISLSERMGRPVSASRPIVDGTMPDGSRINMIYSTDISRKGSSFTIRKFTGTPITAIQLVKWGTFSTELVAYLWLCLENKMNMMVSGETASGKTTSLNAMLPFIDHRAKIYSAEDTPEVAPPQAAWQRCVSRESGPEESRVTMFDLLRAALRSRPDYIVIGEIRGEEGRTAFQAMQTGIPVMATFHAATATKFIQRFTSDPIKVPISFMDNLNILILQSAVNVKGRFLRRVLGVEEFVGFSKESGGVLTRNVFKWDSRRDVLVFRGMYNSYILEEKIALERGYSDKREIYKELKKRERIIQRMVELDIVDYGEVNKILEAYNEKGEDGLPFPV